MALKSVIDIDVRDQSFRDFAERWRKYQDQLAKAPGQWQQQAVQIKGAKRAWDALTTQVFILKELQGAIVSSQRDETRIIEHKVQLWDRLVRSARTFSGTITSAASSLMRMVNPVTFAAGLLGAGSLYGLEKLGLSASAQRRGALGLGVSSGEKRAFELNFGTLIDAPQFLAGVADAMRGPNRQTLYGLGLTEQEINSKNAVQLAVLGLQRLQAKAKATPENQLGFLPGQTNLGQFGVDTETLTALRHTATGEVGERSTATFEDIAKFNVPDATLKTWQKLTTQVERAGDTIEAKLLNNLDVLAPKFTQISADLTESISKLGGPDFKQHVEDFTDGVGKLGDAVKSVSGGSVGGAVAGGLIGRFFGPLGMVGGALLGSYAPGIYKYGVDALAGIKAGAGEYTPGQLELAQRLRANVKNIGLFTSFKDEFHSKFKSPHNDYRAMDIAPSGSPTHQEAVSVAAMLEAEARAAGYTGVRVKPEGLPGFPLSKYGTAPHYHIEWTGRIQLDNRTGASVNASALQAAGGSTK